MISTISWPMRFWASTVAAPLWSEREENMPAAYF
jgi:hypothetical protein